MRSMRASDSEGLNNYSQKELKFIMLNLHIYGKLQVFLVSSVQRLIFNGYSF